MATITKEALQQISSSYGGSNAPRTYREGASQTYVKGELVYALEGYVVELASDTPGAILGLANTPGNNTTAGAKNTSVTLAGEGILFAGNLLTTSGADYTILNRDLCRVAGIQRVTADSKVYLNAAVTGGASARVWIHGLARDSAIGDVNARVIFEFLPTFIQHRATS